MSGIINGAGSKSGVIGTVAIGNRGLDSIENSGSVGISYTAWGTLWDTASWEKGTYFWETHQGEHYTWTCGWIIKGSLGTWTKFGITHQGSYTNHQFSGTNFQVYHGISWGGGMTFYGRWRKVLNLEY